MKRLLGVLFISLLLFSCQNEERKELMEQPKAEKVPDSIQVLTGEIVYGTDAAVIRGEDFVYGVAMDSLSKILAEKVAPLKSDDFDMVPVTIKAKIIPNPRQEGWEEVIEIREIIEVADAKKVSDSIKE